MTEESAVDDRVTSRGHAALIGAVAALAGLCAAEVVGLLLPSRQSPVSLVADRVVASTPDAVRESLIDAVGTLDKPFLALGIVLAVVAGGAAIGVLCAARPALAPWLFTAGGLIGGLVAWDGLTADVLPLAIVIAAGVATAVVVWRRYLPAPATTAGSGPVLERRAVLRATGIIAVTSAIGLGVVTVARRSSSTAVDAVRAALRLPAPTSPAPQLPEGSTPAVPGLAPAITPNADFYQIDVSLTAPAVDVGEWTMTVGGRVDAPMTLTYAQLLALPSIERTITLTCVSNPVGGDLVGTATWQGVRLLDLLATARVRDDADLVLGRSVDGFSAGFPLELLDDGRDAMVAYAMNGEPLPVKHGFPARLVVPGLYGYVSATKWLKEIRLTTMDADVPFWLSRGWSADGTIVSASRIDVPRDGVRIAPGPTMVGGRAWHQHSGVGAVDVSVDGGPWEAAALAPAIGIDAWRLWSWPWTAVDGRHELRVRMRDVDGTPQSEEEHDVFPGASSGLHRITVDVG